MVPNASRADAPDAGASASRAQASTNGCDVIERRQEATADHRAACFPSAAALPYTQCLTGARGGAWGLLVHECTTPEAIAFGFEQRVQYHVVYAIDGDATESEPRRWATVTGATVFDFDGDGENELLVTGESSTCTMSSDFCSGPRIPTAEVWTRKERRLVPYAPSELLPPKEAARTPIALGPAGARDMTRPQLVGIEDVDHDGRPDLLTPLHYELSNTDGDITGWMTIGPSFVARSLPDGSFSLTDDGARRATKARCARTPPVEGARSHELLASAVCERLLGKPVDAVLRAWAQRCKTLVARAKQHEVQASEGDEDDVAVGGVCFDWGEVRGGLTGRATKPPRPPPGVRRMLSETKPL
ncbi:hypothetical protein [Pendulispora albinea]|uniref:FG-GAP repeat protein n=1 Tax=Pendulispora albinea TaxID=2741071 RepID=A0ABZ2LY47_9BACT